MSIYNYIWDPINNNKVNISSKRGKQLLKKYIGILSGGGKKINKNPFRRDPPPKRPTCENYFINNKKRKKYLNGRRSDTPCPDSIVKTKKNKIMRDKLGRWIPYDWNYNNPQSIKALVNKSNRCKKKGATCEHKINKTTKCIECINEKIDHYTEKNKRFNVTPYNIKTNKGFIKEASELKKYLEKINDTNAVALNN